MSQLSYYEQLVLAFSIFGIVFSVSALAFTWWISRPEPPAAEEGHGTAAE